LKSLKAAKNQNNAITTFYSENLSKIIETCQVKKKEGKLKGEVSLYC
jgi:hypothetical protein